MDNDYPTVVDLEENPQLTIRRFYADMESMYIEVDASMEIDEYFTHARPIGQSNTVFNKAYEEGKHCRIVKTFDRGEFTGTLKIISKMVNGTER